MAQAQAENLIRAIIRSIVRECAVREHAVSDTLAAFMVKAVVLEPKNGFNVDRILTKEDVQKLEELCLHKLLKKCSPSLDTVKMQVYFDIHYTSRHEFLEDIHRAALTKLSRVTREITDSRARSREEFDDLYRKIVAYVMLRSGLGSPGDPDTMQEATAAMHSIFPQSKLGVFMVLLKKDKEEQLADLTMNVTGVRLFNRASKEGAIDIQELIPGALQEALPGTLNAIQTDLDATQSLVWKYTAVLERLTDPDSAPGPCDLPIPVLRQALYNVRQHEFFLKMLQADARLCSERVELLQSELSTQIQLLKENIRPKMAVPTAIVFPVFKTVSKLWWGLHDEAQLLNIFNNISLNLQPFLASQAKIFSENFLDSLLEATEVKSDEQRMAESSAERIEASQFKTQEWIRAEEMVGFNDLPLNYNGICGVALVERDGLILPGNPSIGVLKHAGKLYVFSSKQAALRFASNPESFIAEVAEKAKRSPELIHLLKLYQQFTCFSPYSELQSGERLLVRLTTRRDTGIQTELHPLGKNIVKNYEWNEWELRRKALKLADLRTRVTHSMQTNLSHMRRDNVSQTWPPKEVACQTKRDGHSSMPPPQTYLAGLRGKRDAQVVKVDLTRPI